MRALIVLASFFVLSAVAPAEAASCGLLGDPCCPVPSVAPTACQTGLTCVAGICDSIADPTGARPVPVASAAGIVATVALLAGVGGGQLLRRRRRSV